MRNEPCSSLMLRIRSLGGIRRYMRNEPCSSLMLRIRSLGGIRRPA